jgi:hypothetical protein
MVKVSDSVVCSLILLHHEITLLLCLLHCYFDYLLLGMFKRSPWTPYVMSVKF